MNKLEEKKNPFSLFSNCFWCFEKAWKYDKTVFPWWGIRIIFASVSPLILIIIPKMIIDLLEPVVMGSYTPAAVMNDVLLLIGVLIGGLAVLNSVSEYARLHLSGLYYPITQNVLNSYNMKSMQLGLQQLEDTEVLDMMQRGKLAFRGDWAGIGALLFCTPNVILGIVTLLACSGIIFTLHPLMVIALIALLLINALINYKQKLFELTNQRKDAHSMRMQQYYLETMRNFRTGKDVRIYGLSEWLTGKLWRGAWIELNYWHESERNWIKTRSFFTVSNVLQEALLYTYLVYRIFTTGMTIAEFTMYAAAIRTFSSTATDFLEDLAHLAAQSMSISDCRAFFDYQDTDENADDTEGKLSADLTQKSYTIEFDHVSFRYKGQERWALQDLSLTIRGGERLAVVGLNGAGKTTMIKLMCRLYLPTTGTIRLNGVNIQKYGKQEYYKYVSVVFQEIVQFAFPVAENIAMLPMDKLIRSQVDHVLELSRMKDKIDSLPKGMDTYQQKILDAEGIEFSGGENQRLSLARALYKNAPIIILDEPTAALDPLAEFTMYQDFDRLIKDKTAVYISHRLSSTRFCDHVALFENGQMVEYGTHSKLLEQNGHYAKLFHVQAQYYRDNPDAINMDAEVLV